MTTPSEPHFDPDHDGGVDEGLVQLVGSVGPYYPYDLNDPRAPKQRKRRYPFGFAAQTSKPRRSPKRAKKE